MGFVIILRCHELLLLRARVLRFSGFRLFFEHSFCNWIKPRPHWHGRDARMLCCAVLYCAVLRCVVLYKPESLSYIYLVTLPPMPSVTETLTSVTSPR